AACAILRSLPSRTNQANSASSARIAAGIASRWLSVTLSYSGGASRISTAAVCGFGSANDTTGLGVGDGSVAVGSETDGWGTSTDGSTDGVVIAWVRSSGVGRAGRVTVAVGRGTAVGDGVIVTVRVTTGSGSGLVGPTVGVIVWVTVTVTASQGWPGAHGSIGSLSAASARIMNPARTTISPASSTEAVADNAARTHARPFTVRLREASGPSRRGSS